MRIYYLLCSLLYFCDDDDDGGGGALMSCTYKKRYYFSFNHIHFLSSSTIFHLDSPFFILFLLLTVNACYYYNKDIAGALTLEINQKMFLWCGFWITTHAGRTMSRFSGVQRNIYIGFESCPDIRFRCY